MARITRWLGINRTAPAQASTPPSIKGDVLRAAITLSLLCLVIVAGLRMLHTQRIEDPLPRAGVCIVASALAMITNWGMASFQTRGEDRHA